MYTDARTHKSTITLTHNPHARTSSVYVYRTFFRTYTDILMPPSTLRLVKMLVSAHHTHIHIGLLHISLERNTKKTHILSHPWGFNNTQSTTAAAALSRTHILHLKIFTWPLLLIAIYTTHIFEFLELSFFRFVFTCRLCFLCCQPMFRKFVLFFVCTLTLGGILTRI